MPANYGSQHPSETNGLLAMMKSFFPILITALLSGAGFIVAMRIQMADLATREMVSVASKELLDLIMLKTEGDRAERDKISAEVQRAWMAMAQLGALAESVKTLDGRTIRMLDAVNEVRMEHVVVKNKLEAIEKKGGDKP